MLLDQRLTMNDKTHMIDQKHRHVKECRLDKQLKQQPPYPKWIERVFWSAVTAVFAVVIMGFMVS